MRSVSWSLHGAVVHLRSGGLVLYPTETAYAIGCDATNAAAVTRVFALKGRERGKPLPLIAASTTMVWRWARQTPLARALARRHWPGPLTLVLSGRRRLPHGVAARDGSIAIRVSSNTVARALARHLGNPVVATSANRSGQPACYSVRAALQSFGMARWSFPIMIVDVGALPRRRPSTVVDARGEMSIVIRRGKVRIS